MFVGLDNGKIGGKELSREARIEDKIDVCWIGFGENWGKA
jgi:hypothetical protein